MDWLNGVLRGAAIALTVAGLGTVLVAAAIAAVALVAAAVALLR